MHLLTTLFGYDYTYTTTTTTTTGNGSVSPGLIFGLVGVYFVVVLILLIIPLWRIYSKAGRPGWASIIPIYNTWVLFEIVGYPGWWAILTLIPVVNIFAVVMLLVSYFKLAKLFGKGTGFAVCTILFPFVCLPILGYGKSQFMGPSDPVDPLSNGLPPAEQQSSYTPQPIQTFQPSQPPVQSQNPPQNPPVVQG